ncbi:MAG: S1 RNA-binding domain-containing protein [Candidatus Diapherotrites archaeon]|nr:S1 RNA-binding domain-containing protein [Candidatus Diapherotrites archaeon]
MDFPQANEVIVCRITRVLDYGVFVELLEYEGISGFVHISQVSSSWVKNIRAVVKEGQVRAAKVVGFDSVKKQVDLSFSMVPARLQRTKIDEFRSFKRSQKILEMFAKEQKVSLDVIWEAIAVPLMEHYPSLLEGMQQLKVHREKAATGIDSKWMKSVLDLVDRNVESPQKSVAGILELHSLAPDGVELIKQSLGSAMNQAKGHVEVLYTGSGKFRVTSTSFDYKDAERNLSAVGQMAVSTMKSLKGEGKFDVEVK